MNRKEYDVLKRQFEDVRKDAIDAAEKEYDDNMSALDRIYEMTGDGRRKSGRKRAASTPAAVSTTAKPKKKSKKRGKRRSKNTLINAMRQAVDKQSGKFTISEVKEFLTEAKPRLANNTNPAVFSTTMRRMEDLGEIKIVERGKGRRASVYTKA